MKDDKIYSYKIDGLSFQTGDIICTVDGGDQIISGHFWRLIGKLIPGAVDHIIIYTGPNGLCVEANGEGVVTFEITNNIWDSMALRDKRGGLIDSLYGIVYPLQNIEVQESRKKEIRLEVAEYCLRQASLNKPYNLNFFDPNTEDRFYCSQLAYKAYLRFGINLNTGIGVPNLLGTDKIVFPQEIWDGFYHQKLPG